jgi:hypothetical protein
MPDDIKQVESTECIAFAGSRCIASGDLLHVALKTKEIIDSEENEAILIFKTSNSLPIELDFRGSLDQFKQRLHELSINQHINGKDPSLGEVAQQEISRRPGRPKLGVIPREVTLLPRHWEWLANQPGGASGTLRKLVEAAKRTNINKDEKRQSQECTYRFISAMAGNFPGFEEATRALFAADATRFNVMIDAWPVDIKNHAKKMAALAFVK